MLPKVSVKEEKREGERRQGCGGMVGEGRKLKAMAMCFTAYLGLGHFEYRRDIKQIRSGTDPGCTMHLVHSGKTWTCDSQMNVHPRPTTLAEKGVKIGFFFFFF